MGERRPAAVGAERPTAASAPPRRRRRWPRILLVVGVVAVVLLVAVGSVLALAGFPVRRDLDAAKRSLDAGRRAVLAGDPAGAARSFADAERQFADAENAATHGVGRIASDVPGLGRNLVVAAAIARAGGILAGAGADLSHAIQGL